MPTQGDDWDGLQSNSVLPRRFRSSARFRAPAVRVGLPTGHVGATSDARRMACWTGIPTVRIPDVTVTSPDFMRGYADLATADASLLPGVGFE